MGVHTALHLHFQVEVIINDIPSSCDNYDCSFAFTEESTPQVSHLAPSSGQGGTQVTLYGSGFTNDIASIWVTIGGAKCDVIEANSTQITCIAAEHAAGWYSVSVFIDAIGHASINESLCFNYLLTVISISPSVGSIGGGQRITITGNGFFDFSPVDMEEIDDSAFLGLPWFASGFALPATGNFNGLCPLVSDAYMHLLKYSYPHQLYSEIMAGVPFGSSSSESGLTSSFGSEFQGPFDTFALYSIVSAIYLGSGSYIQVGDVPCVITSGNLNTLECITLPHSPGEVNVTVRMLTEEVVLREHYEYSVNHTAFIYSVAPDSGPSFGGTQLQAHGVGFNSDATVHIGSSECRVTAVNNTHIACTTSPHAPGDHSIFVSTETGIAVLSNDTVPGSIVDGIDDDDIPPTFPIFSYKFSVFTVHPFEGSVLGGTELTLYGAGLPDRAHIEVYIGERMCRLLSAQATEVQCITPSSSQTHTVYLEDNGFDPSKFQWACGRVNGITWHEIV